VSGGIQTVPLSVALVAGALVALNPCSVTLLPAFLSYYLGVEREGLPRVRSGLLQRLLVGGCPWGVARGGLLVGVARGGTAHARRGRRDQAAARLRRKPDSSAMPMKLPNGD